MISSKNNLTRDIFKTICYADIFDYPLTKTELYRFLISKEKVSKKDFFKILDTQFGLGKYGSYYFLNGKKSLVTERRKRGIESRKKIEKARRIAGLISFLPWVKFVGLSGSLSMNNSRKHDDIDLFIITSKKRLWTTRLLIVVFLVLLSEKRKRNDLLGRDKICLNMLLSEDAISMPKKLRNLFTAHEVVQVKPLFNKDNTYEKFLDANRWTREFLPNATQYVSDVFSNTQEQTSFSNMLLNAVEVLLFGLQYLYMRSNITSEVVTNSVARFHPKDMKGYVLSLYKLKCKAIFEANFTKKTRFYSRLLT